MAAGNYNYTVALLLHAAKRHRRHGHCGRNLENCRCENDHVIELRMVVDALNQLPNGTYSANRWQRKLIDFFNKKHRNSMLLPREQHRQKTRAVDKWLAGKSLTHSEMKWINEIRETWANTKDHFRQRFCQFKSALDNILDMGNYQRRGKRGAAGARAPQLWLRWGNAPQLWSGLNVAYTTKFLVFTSGLLYRRQKAPNSFCFARILLRAHNFKIMPVHCDLLTSGHVTSEAYHGVLFL